MLQCLILYCKKKLNIGAFMMDVYVDSRTDREVMMDTLSDLSKEVYGFRWRYDYTNMSDVDMQNEYDRLLVELDKVITREERYQKDAELLYDVEVMGLEKDFNISRKDAIRWMMQAQNFNMSEMYSEKENFDNFLYNQGLSSKKIFEEISKMELGNEIDFGY